MAEATDTDYLSIGEVLGLLLEEFPDVTISKIRFLESQGLIDPERTPSGYRKFYEPDVDLLRVILREQRENYLPLRVIKDRLETGAIDPSGELPKPDGERNGDVPTGVDQTDVDQPGHDQTGRDETGHEETGHDETGDDQTGEVGPVDVPPSAVAGHPAAIRPPVPSTESSPPSAAPNVEVPAVDADRDVAHHDDHTPVSPQLLPGVVLDREELCGMVGLTASQLTDLESYGIVTGRGNGAGTVFGEDAVEIAKIAVEFLRAGVDARHLRGWRTAAEREASLYEQLVTPRLRQRNPEARAEVLASLRRLDDLGGRLRSAMVRTSLRHHFDG